MVQLENSSDDDYDGIEHDRSVSSEEEDDENNNNIGKMEEEQSNANERPRRRVQQPQWMRSGEYELRDTEN